jgi:hypothetical protein
MRKQAKTKDGSDDEDDSSSESSNEGGTRAGNAAGTAAAAGAASVLGNAASEKIANGALSNLERTNQNLSKSALATGEGGAGINSKAAAAAA